ncbi:VOC family protein [Paenibacillus albiflavus]|uniref:VOC family protein n=1 Tax=Paenibacillus albiflavus TaxID=2545760 RepID=A0A4R4ENN0_9BACL|nr:VOC family protein [Paenibacillus albiflavus]TCZ80141.1 VOC family protein [Paenibacillus albiflavus]
MSKVKFSVQVLLVSDLARSQNYYRDVLGCEVNDFWAVRDEFALGFKLMQANDPADVQPNKSGKGQLIPWDTYAYVDTHDELNQLIEQLKSNGAKFIQEPVAIDQGWGIWKEFAIEDPDGYAIGFGSGKKS